MHTFRPATTKLCSIIVFINIFFAHAAAVFAQQTDEQANEDTIVVMRKDVARKLISEYSDVNEVENDLVPDASKEWMVTDRPNIAQSPSLVAKGSLQWETGFQLNTTTTSSNRRKDIIYDDMLVRIGLSRRIEARLEISYLGTRTIKNRNDSLKKHTDGFSGLDISSKVFLFDEKGFRPKAALLYGLSLPYIGSLAYRPENTGGNVRLLFSNEFTEYYELEYNVGIEWSGESKQAAYTYALNNECKITERFNAFMELYGSFTENNGNDDGFNGTFIHDHRVNGGFWYLFTKDVQVDASVGFGLSAASPDYYFAFGLSNRFSLSKIKY